MDTVGAVCMDSHGHLCAGVSSGGVVYKTPGRIGQVCFSYHRSVLLYKRTGVVIGRFENNP